MSKRGFRPVPLKLLASGIDTLHLSARGRVRDDVWEAVEAAKARAQAMEGAVPFDFPVTEQAFLLKPHGLRGYSYWLASPDFELLLGRSERFPAALVQLHAAYLHSLGPEWAIDLAVQLLRLDVFTAPPDVVVSRVDLYADSQGWQLELLDLSRFVCRGRSRRAFVERQQAFASGRRLTGFMFGRDALVARVYDKTEEIRRRGGSWLTDLWGERADDRAVWRVELQLRRDVLAEFNLRSVLDVLAGVQDLWHYGTESWLTLRLPTDDRRERRWPIDPLWREVQAVRIAPAVSGVVRKRLIQMTEERLVQGLQGYLTSWAALRGSRRLDDTMEAVAPILERYMATRGRTFAAEVQHKRVRLMSVTALLDVSGENSADE
jgi:hypothetical protein